MGGGALSGLIVMRFEGEGVLAGDERARHANLWFIAHEVGAFLARPGGTLPQRLRIAGSPRVAPTCSRCAPIAEVDPSL